MDVCYDRRMNIEQCKGVTMLSLPTLETKRLTIREYTTDDLENRHQLMAEVFGDDDEPLSSTEAWLEWTVRNYSALGNLYQPPYGDRAVVLKSTGEVIGSVGLVPTVVPWDLLENGQADPILTSPEFGLFYGILPAHWGKGYALEAIQPIIDWVFETLSAKHIVATTEHDNHNSQRIMQKLGMRLLKNTTDELPWCQVVGVLDHPKLR